MGLYKPEIKYIPYQQEGEPARRAAITHVEFSTDGLSEKDIQVLGHLNDAADAMNEIFRDQYEPYTVVIHELVRSILPASEGETLDKLTNYLTLLNLQNSPYALLPRKNHQLNLTAGELREQVGKIPGDLSEYVDRAIDLMLNSQVTPDRANFYPEDLSEEEYKELEHSVNSLVRRDEDGTPYVVLNEEWYTEELEQVIYHLQAARDITDNASFRLYLDAKILELMTGTPEARRLADYTWVRHDSPIDIVISTALEVYLDNYKNARGAAAACVSVRNNAAEDLLASLVERVPRFEKEAPWTHRKESFDPERLPKLKFVDVLNWTGDYVTGPFTTIAQSLPNDEWVIQNIGTVNMVYMNTGKAVHGVSGNLAAGEFLTKAEFDSVNKVLFEANQLHSALHEIGHTTGKMDAEHSKGQPKDYLEEEYSFLEETRAELFGLWSLDILLQDKIISRTMANACYDGMLITMITSLKFDPVQAHNKARNGIFHFMEEKGAIVRVEEDEKQKFSVKHEKAHAVVTEMLKMVADIKASGDKEAAVKLRETYVYTDELKAEVEARTSDFPLGRGLVFPYFRTVDGEYSNEMEYPKSFNDQNKFLLELGMAEV